VSPEQGDRTPGERLAALGLTLPKVTPPLAAYVPAVRTGSYVYTAGQLPVADGKLLATGKVGADIGTAEAAALARTCALNALAAVTTVTGGLDAIVRIVKVTGFVASGLTAAVITVCIFCLFGLLWFAFPLTRRGS